MRLRVRPRHFSKSRLRLVEVALASESNAQDDEREGFNKVTFWGVLLLTALHLFIARAHHYEVEHREIHGTS